MRESSKIDKTKLPVDVYEGWLETQSVPAEKRLRHDRRPTDSYEVWLGQRIQKVRAGITKLKKAQA